MHTHTYARAGTHPPTNPPTRTQTHTYDTHALTHARMHTQGGWRQRSLMNDALRCAMAAHCDG